MEDKLNRQEDEISLRDLIFKIKSFAAEVFRYWHIPAVCIALAIGYQIYSYVTFVPVYPATITFSVDEEEGGGSSGLTGILGQFGLGSVRPSRYNLDKILALSKSRTVIEHTLFTTMELDGKNDYLANHLIHEYDMKSSDGTKQEAFVFTHDSLAAFTRSETIC